MWMIGPVSAAMILTAAVFAPIERKYPDAEVIFTCDFETEDDLNHDRWPDNWTRFQGEGFPHYIDIKITETNTNSGARALKFQMNGGAAALYSPPIEIDGRHAYVLEGHLRNIELVHNQLTLSVTFLDAQQQPVHSVRSEILRQTTEWKKIRIGPLDPPNETASYAVLGLHVDPGHRADLSGSAWFDDIWFARLPRMRLAATAPHNLFTDRADVEIRGEITGATQENLQMEYLLLDWLGHPVHRQVVDVPLAPQPESRANLFRQQGPPQNKFQGELSWKPPLEAVGFYRVEATLFGAEGPIHFVSIPIAVVPPVLRPARGDFGWSLAEGAEPFAIRELPVYLTQAGVGQLKFPVWYDPADVERGAQLAELAQQLDDREIDLIGLLTEPPQAIREQFPPDTRLLAADIFGRDAQRWFPTLEPVLTRLGMRVSAWQLGGDYDTSFADNPHLAQQAVAVRRRLEQTGQGLRIGTGWSWDSELPSGASVPWNFVSLSALPSLTAQELTNYLQASRAAPLDRWVVIEPLPRDAYQPRQRVADLVLRMVSAKAHGAESIFCPRPLSLDRGLLEPTGEPGELFLPWRTTAMLLAGSTYLGSFQLPGGSPNAVFARDDEAIMVAWNSDIAEERMFFGDKIYRVDVQGRTERLAPEDGRHHLQLDNIPIFITGMDRHVAEMRIQLQLAGADIPNSFGQQHMTELMVTNPFNRGASGTVEIMPPEAWRIPPIQAPLRLPAGATEIVPFEMRLPFDALLGQHMLRMNFEVIADRVYQFDVYRPLWVGRGDVSIDLSTHLNAQGDLVVEQTVTNLSDQPLTLKCYLFAPGRRRTRSNVVNLQQGTDTQTYTIADGAELLGGNLMLRAEEVYGPRIFNLQQSITP